MEETNEERERRLRNEEAERMLNSGVSYLKMKKMKERAKLGIVEVSTNQAILDGGKSRAIELQYNRDTYNSLISNNFRGDDLTASMTMKLNQTLRIKEQQLQNAINDNMDVDNRGEFVFDQRKHYVQRKLKGEIINIEKRKMKIDDFVNTGLIAGRTAVLFGEIGELSP